MATKGTWALFAISLLFCASNLVNLIINLRQCTTTTITSSTSTTLFNEIKVSTVKNSKTFISPFTSHYSSSMSCHLKEDPFERYICEVEASTVFYSPKTHPLVVARDLSVFRYYAQRDLQGWSYAYKSIDFELTEYAFKQTGKLSEASVLLCLGIISQDKFCLKPASYKLLNQGQRISQIHGMRDTLWRKDAFCFTLREALRGYKGWNKFTFPCWVLPQDKVSLEKELTGNIKPYIVKPAFRGEGHGIYVVQSYKEITQSSTENYVVQPFLVSPFLVRGHKFDLRTYVLVTSISPLRVYFYEEGLVRFASGKYNQNATRGGKEHEYLTNTSVGKKFSQLSNLTWTYAHLKRYLQKRNINTTKVFSAVQNAITRTLLASEYRFISDIKFNLGGYSCQHCFHLLGVDVILDDSLHPIVIEVNGLPSMQLSHEMGVLPNPNSSYTTTKYGLLRDMMHILYGNVSVSTELAQNLQQLRVGIGPGPLCDPSKHLYCLDMKTLQFLISSVREGRLSGRFRKIYPVNDGEKYSRFIKHMNDLINKKFDKPNNLRTLWQIHHLITALEKFNIKI